MCGLSLKQHLRVKADHSHQWEMHSASTADHRSVARGSAPKPLGTYITLATCCPRADQGWNCTALSHIHKYTGIARNSPPFKLPPVQYCHLHLLVSINSSLTAYKLKDYWTGYCSVDHPTTQRYINLLHTLHMINVLSFLNCDYKRLSLWNIPEKI